MKQFVAIESSSSRVFVVNAKNEEEAYRVVGRDIYGMDFDTLDTGNVDVDLFAIVKTKVNGAIVLE
jgi:hypothetical protein